MATEMNLLGAIETIQTGLMWGGLGGLLLIAAATADASATDGPWAA